MKSSLLRLALLLIVTVCRGQADFRPGFIVNNNRDTIYGSVKYKERAGAYRSCEFRRDGSEVTETYAPADILGYAYSGDKVFESISAQDGDQPSFTAFFEVLVRGRGNLYKLDNTFWVNTQDQKLQLLKNEAREVVVNNQNVLKNSNEHIATLTMLFADCVSLFPAIQKEPLKQQTLTKLVDQYNQCQGGQSIVFAANKPWTKLHVGLVGTVDYLQMTGFETTWAQSIGASLDVWSPRITERFSFHAELLYTSPSFIQYSETSESGSIVKEYITMDLQQLKIPFGFRYTFRGTRLMPYVNVGIENIFNLSSATSWIREVETGSDIEIYNIEFPTPDTGQLGFWGSVGAVKSITKKFDAFFEFRLERTKVATSQTQTNFPVTGYQLVLGIRTR